MDQKKEWFAAWFNTPYYHILYQNRNEEEASAFIDTLLNFLKPHQEAKFLDLACGKGRHSIYINNKGYKVHGTDLSKESIRLASLKSNDKLSFAVHDMREAYLQTPFDYIFNLFTSFGYFKNTQDNLKVLKCVEAALTEEGYFVMDFMNAKKVVSNLVPSESVNRNGLIFNITRKVEDGIIKKKIAFRDNGIDYDFQEEVQALTYDDMKPLFASANLEIVHVFGDYQLSTFDEENSSRLILMAKKSS